MAVLFGLLVLAVVELLVLVQVADAVGALWAILGLIAVSLFGLWLVKREGLKVWRRFNETLLQGSMPSAEMADGVVILGAGALLVFPGFVTGIVGIVLLLPPAHGLARNALLRRSDRRVQVIRATYQGTIIDTTATDDPAPPSPPRGELNP